MQNKLSEKNLPQHIKDIQAEGIKQIKLIDATPIGINIRSTVATYANIHDELRKVFARTKNAKDLGYKAGDFSYNTGSLRCPTCDGTGSISLDVQFLPDVDISCPDCHGSRYSKESERIKYITKSKEEYTISEIMAMDINNAIEALKDINSVKQKLKVLKDLGLGYLTLGEATPSLSGGEAERLKLAKPVINSTCPESFEFFKKDIPKSHEKGNLSKSFSKIILSQILFFSEKHL